MLNPDGTWRTDLVGPDGKPITHTTASDPAHAPGDRVGADVAESRGDPPEGPATTDATTSRGDTTCPNVGADGSGDSTGVPSWQFVDDAPLPDSDTHASANTDASDADDLDPRRRCTTPRVLWKRTGAAGYEPLNTRHHPEEELAEYTAIAERDRRR